ncbi:MAG: tyrosine-type recombinase/integrase [Elusimicrobia bacterium]|nr:tyrosine-type recombinase/integrase [Elusimicrobiota bacterium]
MIELFFRWRSALTQVLSTPAGSFLDGLVATLARQGFGRWDLRQRVHGAAHFSFWLAGKGVSLNRFHEDALPSFKAHLNRCHCPGGWRRSQLATQSAVAGASLLLQHLRQLSVVVSPTPTMPQARLPPLLQGLNEWLRLRRGLQEKTLTEYGRTISSAIATLGNEPAKYTPQSIRAFILKKSKNAGRGEVKLMATAMRHFLRYLVAQGQCRPGLEDAVPSIAMWRLAVLPRYLPADDVNRIIAACDRDTPVGLRDRAILLLLARLGLRSGDVSALAASDIDWRQASVHVVGKSRVGTKLPLTQEVGDALTEYLKKARPPVDTDRVFVRMQAPWGPLKVSGISALVGRAILRAGVESPSYGAHVLRHSAATAMLREGASLDQIGAVLRHQYLDTTAIYAKVDIPRLRQIALPWPEVEPC